MQTSNKTLQDLANEPEFYQTHPVFLEDFIEGNQEDIIELGAFSNDFHKGAPSMMGEDLYLIAANHSMKTLAKLGGEDHEINIEVIRIWYGSLENYFLFDFEFFYDFETNKYHITGAFEASSLPYRQVIRNSEYALDALIKNARQALELE